MAPSWNSPRGSAENHGRFKDCLGKEFEAGTSRIQVRICIAWVNLLHKTTWSHYLHSTPQHVLIALCLIRHKAKFTVLIINLTPPVNSTGSHISCINVHTINIPCFLPYLFPVLHLTNSRIRQLQTGQKDLIFDIQQPTITKRFQGNAVKVSRIMRNLYLYTIVADFYILCAMPLYRFYIQGVFKKLGPMHTFLGARNDGRERNRSSYDFRMSCKQICLWIPSQKQW
jgi:hypothetical protein